MTTKMVPDARPEMDRATAEALLKSGGVDVSKPALLGRRGYYRDSMGEVGVQERGIYDDAIVLVTPTAYVTFNANCDPSRHRKGIANLKAGLWSYKVGIHGLSKPKDRQYQALVQAGKVAVVRDGEGEETGFFGINIHRGSFSTTSSEGCQTIHPTQWESFIATVKAEMQRHGVTTIPYLLTER
jgi:hypothetical protein